VNQPTFDFTEASPVTALSTWRLAPGCSFGTPTLAGRPFAPGWGGSHHCWFCNAAVEQSCAEFAAAVARGEYDADGYTPAERRVQKKRKAAA
jgi:hypothetical protein